MHCNLVLGTILSSFISVIEMTNKLYYNLYYDKLYYNKTITSLTQWT